MRRIGLFIGSAPVDLPGTPMVVDAHPRWGEPSAQPAAHRLGDVELIVLPRHGSAHDIAPHQVNYRANVWLMHQLGVEFLIAAYTVGGIDPALSVGDIVVPQQLIDYTWGRAQTYDDQRRHVEFSQPFDAQLCAAFCASDKTIIAQGVYGCTQGPRLETAAEIRRMARDGCTLVGMTAMPEVGLARELEMPVIPVCLVVNPAAGVSEGPIDLEAIRAAGRAGAQRQADLVRQFCSVS
jgi:purine nucleoside phosphorylase